MGRMTTTPTGRARPRVFWADARFFLGLVLIAASVAGVWFVVAAARQTTPVLAAAHTIVPGDAVDAGSVRVVDVALGVNGPVYLDPDDVESGLIATRTIGEGELVPVAALGEAGTADTTSIVVHSSTDVPGAVDTGSVVEVWAAAREDDGDLGAPEILVADAVVARVARDDAVIGGSAVSLELVIPREDVSAALAAISTDAAISVIPTGASAP